MIRYEPDGTAALLADEGMTGPHVRVGKPWEGYSLHSPQGGGTAVSCELPVPADGGQPDAGHDQ
jgi:hypothetical protein